MKKLLISFLVCAMFLTFTSSVKAYSIDDLMSQLTSLQQQVNNLQSQLGAAAVNSLNTNTTVVACSPTTSPWIKITSPNGGENFTAGQQITVNWTSCNVSTSGNVSIFLSREEGIDGSYNPELLNSTLNDGSQIVNIPTIAQGLSAFGQYFKISVFNSTVNDQSNNFFSISNPNFPIGCPSSLGYSSITGLSCGCNGTVYSTYNGQLCPQSPLPNLPIGCTLSSGYSTITSLSCGCNGTVYSTYNGQLCPTIINDSSSTLKSKANPSPRALEVASPNASFKRTLKVGIKGDDVKALQNILIQKGFLSTGNNSGYYGLLTKAAVVKYQSSNGLQSDGKAGLKTLEKINIE